MPILSNTPKNVDMVVVGSGAAGSVIAAKMAAAGQSVVLLEAGPERKLSDLVSSQIWARGLKWSGSHVEEAGNHMVNHGFNAGFGSGGSALHHYGVWPRLHENDFNVRSRHGKSLDWPISYDDLRPYYDEVQAELGLSGDAKSEVWRPLGEPYPMPPLPIFKQGAVIAAGFEKLGKKTAPIPMAINSQVFNGKPPCSFDGWCDAGCPIGALKNPLVIHLAEAKRLGVDIRYGCQVSRIIAGERAKKEINAIEYYDNAGEPHKLNTKTIVLAAYTVQTARILLNSEWPDGVKIGNESGNLGKYLTTHPGISVFGLFKDETDPHFGPTGGQLISQDAYDKKDFLKGAFGSYQWLIANALKVNDYAGYAITRPDMFGRKMKAFLAKASRHVGNMLCIAEDNSSFENQITLSPHKDKFGIPLASTIHDSGPEQDKLMDHALEEGKEIFRAGGATEVWNTPRKAIHIMGGTVMGDDPSRSVTDEYGRVHSTNNVFVAGPGLFPTSGAVNPTFSVYALAYRTADHLLKL